MADNAQASRRYAEALVQASGTDEELELYKNELLAFKTAIADSPDLRNVLLNPIFTTEDRDGVLAAIMKSLDLSEKMQRFLVLLTERDRMDAVEEIADVFRTLADQRAGRVLAHVESAAPLSEDAQSQLKRALEKKTGKKIELEVTVDQSLIGGIRTQVGSQVFDGTIRSELDRLKNTLTV